MRGNGADGGKEGELGGRVGEKVEGFMRASKRAVACMRSSHLWTL